MSAACGYCQKADGVVKCKDCDGVVCFTHYDKIRNICWTCSEDIDEEREQRERDEDADYCCRRGVSARYMGLWW